MTSKLILMIINDLSIRNIIQINLKREGYNFKGIDSGDAGLAMLRSLCTLGADPASRPELVVLDQALPGVDGLSICRRLKSNSETWNIPVVMLSSLCKENDIVTGLEAGADDYITKPFSPRILLARIRTLLRIHCRLMDYINSIKVETETGGIPKNEEGQIIEVGKIYIDVGRHEVRCCGNPIELSATEFAILEFLAQKPGLVFMRNRIIDAVKGKGYPVTERSVDVQIWGLRKKLGSLSEYVQTVRGVGYRLVDN